MADLQQSRRSGVEIIHFHRLGVFLAFVGGRTRFTRRLHPREVRCSFLMG